MHISRWDNNILRLGEATITLPYRIDDVIEVQGVIVVLFNYTDMADAIGRTWGALENLVGIDEDGAVIWTANVPTSYGDCYVAIEEELGQIVAHSWTELRVRIDPRTGSIADRG